MGSLPLVSIVVPTFNQGHYLPVALDSLMFQDYGNIEIIIANHGSTDGTSDIIKAWMQTVETENVSFLHYFQENKETDFIRSVGKRYPQNRKIKIVESSENIGGTRSYNEGFKAASGKYCTYLVADDYFLPHALSTMVDNLEFKKADVVFSDMHVVNDEGRILQRLEKPDYDFKTSLADWFHLGVSRLYRRSLHDKSGYYDPEYRNANDYDMFLRFAMDGASFFHIQKVLYCTRKHDPKNPDEPASWRNNGYENLMRESKRCALRARKYLQGVVQL
jgi:glycosyltransferase involved in cell wall biosynthesis